MLSSFKPMNNGGETIVEVLIVMMVLGSVLTGAFVITGKATNANQASQERSEAAAYGQGQIERLKSLLASDTTANPSGNFCMSEMTNRPVNVVDTTVGGCLETVHSRYAGYFVHDTVTDSYNETIVWASAGGGYDTVTMRYKVANE